MTIWIQPALLTSFTQRGGCSLPAALSCKVRSCDGSDTRAGSGDQHHLVSQTGILCCPHHYLYQQQDRPNIGLIKVCLIRNFRQKTKSNRNIFFIILHIQSAKLFIKTWATQHSPIYLITKSRYLNFECSVFVLKGDYVKIHNVDRNRERENNNVQGWTLVLIVSYTTCKELIFPHFSELCQELTKT